MKQTSKHEFAFFVSSLSDLIKHTPGSLITLTDQAILSRMTSVLRVQPEQRCIFFDTHVYAHCTIQQVTKKSITFALNSKQTIAPLKPAITILLPLLKKDDFEASLYAAVELGANTIQLISTEKTQRSWQGDKEYDRCYRIMVAAAEQSKNFALPILHQPAPLYEYVSQIDKTVPTLYFDPKGETFFSCIQNFTLTKTEKFILMVGPEGDLTDEEKSFIQAQGFVFCSLTPTVLRSVQALSLGLGMLRSIIQ